MHSLFQNDPRYNDSRDAISLFVSLCTKGFLVERTFYEFLNFNNYYESEQSELKRLNIEVIKNVLSESEFTELFQKFLKKLKKDNPNETFGGIRIPLLNEPYSQDDIDSINKLFSKYCYLIKQRRFTIDPTTKKADELLSRLAIYTKQKFDDFIEKPIIEDIDLDDTIYELRIYNAGQANCSALIKYDYFNKEDYKVIMVFDFGFQKRWGANPELEDMINKIDENTTILISHFDSDHINNLASHLLAKTKRWIFPNCDKSKKKASKLFKILLKRATTKNYSNTIYEFPTPYKLNENITIYQYKGKHKNDKFQSTLCNSQCLVTNIITDNTKILIPADALYNEFDPNVIRCVYDYILIPHHCCEYPTHYIDSIAFDIKSIMHNNTKGIILCGYNKYKHPHITHKSQYNNIKQFNSLNKKRGTKEYFYPIEIKI